MDLRADIVVIGGGLSGATAALRAASLGREVVLVRKGYGATAIGSGTFDVLGGSPCENLGLLTGERFDSAHEFLSLAKRLPLHPYGLLADVHGGHAEEAWSTFQRRFEAASSFLLDRLAKAGHGFAGRLDAITAHTTTQGTFRWTNLAPLSVHRADVAAFEDARVVFVGIEGVGAFDASFVGRSLTALLRDERPRAIDLVDFRTLRIPWARATGGLLPAEVARDLDNLERREEFAEELTRAISGGRFSHAIVAPCLGIASHPETLDLLSQRTGLNVSEPLVGPPHAIHGLRIQKALDRALSTSSVRVVGAQVTGAETTHSVVNALRGEGEEGAIRVRAERFVLASGRYVGGGLRGRGTLQEAIFDLPVFHHGRSVNDRPVFSLLRPGFRTRQPAFDAGLRASADLRPLREDSRVAFGNLYACGTILGGYDLALDGTGPGVNLLTGFAAGEIAAGSEGKGSEA
ncbi:MAG: hypothetical protein A2Y95_08620 [Deltaproteobacteria bacterium RBG_13_65_10]|nr:MAG: hypothetical protein A2Y95_08620 [Deltaproteobacteria bacterium RBG_13_65_10]